MRYEQVMMKPNIPNLRSRRGEAYMLLTVIFLGFSVIVMSLAIDGLGMAVTYRRAVGLATVGAQAGTGVLMQFDGSTPELASNACAVAIDTVIASLPNGSASDKAQRELRATRQCRSGYRCVEAAALLWRPIGSGT